MFKWQHQALFEEAGEGTGGGTGVVTETAEQKELRETREENTRLRTERDSANSDAKQWSERALRATRTPEPVEPAEPKDVSQEDLETGEQLLDDVSKDGLKALRKRGFVTMKEVQALVAESIERAQGDGRTEGQFQDAMQREFPEMAEDLARVEAGKKPENEIFILAADIYNEARKLDPALTGSKSALLMATRQAAAQLALQGKRKVDTEVDRQATRRGRIEAQTPARGNKSDDDEPAALTAKQKQMAADMGISEKKFTEQQAKIKGSRG